jgi:hypothetical protein
LELVQVLSQKMVGRPKRDPITGDMLDQKLGSTDVTSVWRRPATSPENTGYEFMHHDAAIYRQDLAEQQRARMEIDSVSILN